MWVFNRFRKSLAVVSGMVLLFLFQMFGYPEVMTEQYGDPVLFSMPWTPVSIYTAFQQ